MVEVKVEKFKDENRTRRKNRERNETIKGKKQKELKEKRKEEITKKRSKKRKEMRSSQRGVWTSRTLRIVVVLSLFFAFCSFYLSVSLFFLFPPFPVEVCNAIESYIRIFTSTSLSLLVEK